MVAGGELILWKTLRNFHFFSINKSWSLVDWLSGLEGKGLVRGRKSVLLAAIRFGFLEIVVGRAVVLGLLQDLVDVVSLCVFASQRNAQFLLGVRLFGEDWRGLFLRNQVVGVEGRPLDDKISPERGEILIGVEEEIVGSGQSMAV